MNYLPEQKINQSKQSNRINIPKSSNEPLRAPRPLDEPSPLLAFSESGLSFDLLLEPTRDDMR